MNLVKGLITALFALVLVSCTSESQIKDKVIKILKENPSILTEAIEQNPAEFVEAFQKAVKKCSERAS